VRYRKCCSSVGIGISGGAQEQAQGRLVSENYFPVLGVESALGRLFSSRMRRE